MIGFVSPEVGRDGGGDVPTGGLGSEGVVGICTGEPGAGAGVVGAGAGAGSGVGVGEVPGVVGVV